MRQANKAHGSLIQYEEDAESRLTLERSLVGDVVNEENAHGAAIVGCRDGSESFLASSVPYLQLHTLAIELNGPDLEVDTDGCDEGGRERVLTKPQQAARFAHARVAD